MTFRTDCVAILLATYNGERFLSQQLDSIIKQSCTNWELFIHDDGSSDLTCEIIKEYVSDYPNQIHLVEWAPQGGAKSNFLFLMSQVDAPYYMFCDQDDVWNQDKIECSLYAIRTLESDNGTDIPLLAFSDSTVVDSDLNIIHNSFLSYQGLNADRLRFSELIVQNVVSGNASIFNRSLLEYALKYTSEESIIMHDHWCALIAAYYGKIAFIEESTLLYRQHDSNTLGAIPNIGLRHIISRLKKKDDITSSILATRTQADEFAKSFELDSDSLPARYATIGELNKWRRCRFYLKYHFRKSRLPQNIGFYLFG